MLSKHWNSAMTIVCNIRPENRHCGIPRGGRLRDQGLERFDFLIKVFRVWEGWSVTWSPVYASSTKTRWALTLSNCRDVYYKQVAERKGLENVQNFLETTEIFLLLNSSGGNINKGISDPAAYLKPKGVIAPR